MELEIIEFLRTLNGIGLPPYIVVLAFILWKQDKRLTVAETILKGGYHYENRTQKRWKVKERVPLRQRRACRSSQESQRKEETD